jgi:hypothetical protein
MISCRADLFRDFRRHEIPDGYRLVLRFYKDQHTGDWVYRNFHVENYHNQQIPVDNQWNIDILKRLGGFFKQIGFKSMPEHMGQHAVQMDKSNFVAAINKMPGNLGSSVEMNGDAKFIFNLKDFI